MTLEQAIEWAHRAEPAEVFIASHPRKTQNALWELVAEVERLQRENEELKAELTKTQKSLDQWKRANPTDAIAMRTEPLKKQITDLKREVEEAKETIEQWTTIYKNEVVLRHIAQGQPNAISEGMANICANEVKHLLVTHKERDRYKAALEDIADGNSEDCKDCVYNTKIAQEALNE